MNTLNVQKILLPLKRVYKKKTQKNTVLKSVEKPPINPIEKIDFLSLKNIY